MNKYVPKTFRKTTPRYTLCTISTKDPDLAMKACEVKSIGFSWEEIMWHGVNYIITNNILPKGNIALPSENE